MNLREVFTRATAHKPVVVGSLLLVAIGATLGVVLATGSPSDTDINTYVYQIERVP